MIIDIATDLWQAKENIRIEVPPTVSSMPVSALWAIVNRYYTRQLRATAPVHMQPDARSMTFAVEGIRLLVLDRTTSSGSKWVPLDSCMQLTPYCQLYAFQAPDPRHGDAQAAIPVARMVRATVDARPRSPTVPIATPKSPTTRRSAQSPVAQRAASHRNGTTTPNRAGPSPRRIDARADDAAGHATLDSDAAAVFRFLSTGSLAGDSTPTFGTGSVCNTAVLSQLLQSVGVNLTHWQDPRYRFLASEKECTATRPFMGIDEFEHFCGTYQSLVKLIHRFLIARYGHALATGRAAAHSTSPLATTAERKDWSPPRARSSPSASPQRAEATSMPRQVSPTRASTSPARRQHSVSLRLFSGLASIPTAKDRRMRIYDPC